MLNDLIKTGLSEQEIADKVGTSQPTINRLRNRIHKTTSFDIGTGISRLYEEHCPGKQVA